MSVNAAPAERVPGADPAAPGAAAAGPGPTRPTLMHGDHAEATQCAGAELPDVANAADAAAGGDGTGLAVGAGGGEAAQVVVECRPGTQQDEMVSDGLLWPRGALREAADWYAARRGWTVQQDPDGSLWLPAGEDFDVLDVPGPAGRAALALLLGYGQAALAPGPVALAEPGRCLFFTAPGARDDLPELLEWLDWGGIRLDLTARGAGERVPAPGPGAWLHDPAAVPPEVVALLATIAQCCSRHVLAVSSRRVASPRRGD